MRTSAVDTSGGPSLIWLEGESCPGCRRVGNSLNNGLICLLVPVTLLALNSLLCADVPLRTYTLTLTCDFIQYARRKNSFCTSATGSNKTRLANEDNLCSIKYSLGGMISRLVVDHVAYLTTISLSNKKAYSIKVDFSSMDEAQMERQTGSLKLQG